jgi:hypothetical protein
MTDTDMSDDREPPPESKLTRSKERWAREGRFSPERFCVLKRRACRRASI